MAIPTFLPADAKKEPPKHRRKNEKLQKSQKVEKVIVNQKHNSSWNQIKKLLTCKQMEGSRVHDPTSKSNQVNSFVNRNGYYSKLGSSCNSRICTFRDVVHGSTSRGENSQESCDVEAALLRRKTAAVSGSSSSSSRSSSMRSKGGSGSGSGAYSGTASMNASTSCRAMQFRKMSGCYECHMIVDPSRYPLPRSSICVCSKCGEVFPKMESLELHQAVKHAVSELGPEDSGRNIVEIIFKSSWLKRDNPICKIERILKVHNTPRTIQRFEECRDAVKIRATANTIKNPRCDADGNELLRFHCTTLTCSLGARGSSTLCGSVQGTHGAAQGTCGVCTVIRHGFKGHKTCEVRGVRTTASSSRAHDCLSGSDSRRAMLVCRVIAGRVKHTAVAEAEEDGLWYDSVAGYAGVYSNLEELYVSNPRAILPCFVVIYKVGYIME